MWLVAGLSILVAGSWLLVRKDRGLFHYTGDPENS
jgi:hypothetical protein